MSQTCEAMLENTIKEFKEKLQHTPTVSARTKLQAAYNKVNTLAGECCKTDNAEQLANIKDTLIKTIMEIGVISVPFAKAILPTGKHSDYHYLCELLKEKAKITKNRTAKWFERNIMDDFGKPKFSTDRIHMLVLIHSKSNGDTSNIPNSTVHVASKEFMNNMFISSSRDETMEVTNSDAYHMTCNCPRCGITISRTKDEETRDCPHCGQSLHISALARVGHSTVLANGA